MAISVGTDEGLPNYHLKLSGVSNVGVAKTLGLILCNSRGEPDAKGIRKTSYPRTALKIGQGNSGYGDFEMPYTPIVQDDWSGGRGQAEFEKDTTRYYDGYRADAIKGPILAGPKATASGGWVNTTDPYNNLPYITGDPSLYCPTSDGLSDEGLFTYTAGVATEIIGSITLYFKETFFSYGSEYFQIRCTVRSNSSGTPGAVIATSSVTLHSSDYGAKEVTFDFTSPVTLTASTVYWIGAYIVPEAGAYGDILIGYKSGANAIYKCVQPTGTMTLQGVTGTLLAHLVSYSSRVGRKRFFEYKGQLYASLSPDDGTTPTLMMNGFRGVAVSNSTDLSKTNANAAHSLPGGTNLTGKIVKIVGGAGLTEEQTWRTISSNTTGASYVLTVSPNWTVAQDTTTEFVILGYDTWYQITGTTGVSSPGNIHDMDTTINRRITDILVVDDTVYFCMGTAAVIAKIRLQTSGTWNDVGTETGKYADFMKLLRNKEGVRKIWRAEAVASKASCSSTVAWGTVLSWSSDITCGNTDRKITNLVPYGDPQLPWILKEDSFGSIDTEINNEVTTYVYNEVPLSEMKNVRDDVNGKSSIQHGVYLYFSMQDGLERYYEQRMDDVGPNRDEGLPLTRKGVISELVGYPGRFYAAIDGGASGYSCVLCHNGIGWHEIYRGDVGARIQEIYIQTIPGPDNMDRLWVSEGYYAYSMPIVINPRNYSGYRYHDGAYIISSWIYGGFKDVNKFWKSISVFADDMSSTTPVEVYYQTDNEGDSDAWHLVSATYASSPETEFDISATNAVYGKRIRYKIVLNANTDGDTAPRINAVRINAVTRVPPKSSYQLTFLIEDSYVELDGVRTTTTASSLDSVLSEISDSKLYATPMLMNSNFEIFDNKYVFVDPMSFQLLEAHMGDAWNDTPEHKIKAIGQVTVYEA